MNTRRRTRPLYMPHQHQGRHDELPHVNTEVVWVAVCLVCFWVAMVVVGVWVRS